MDELKELVPSAREVTLGPELKVAIEPVTVGRLPAVLACTGALTAIIDLLDGKRDEQIDWRSALQNAGGELLDLVAAAGPLKREEVDQLNLAQFAILAKHLFEVNRDFFVAHVLPQLSGLEEVVAGLRGRMLSSASSQAATGATTS